MPPFVIQERYSGRRNDLSPLMECDELLRGMIASGGPVPNDYAHVNRALRHLGDAVRAGLVSREDVLSYAHDITSRHLEGTMQARALGKKYGYSGDFEIIEAIYTLQIAQEPHLRRWDLYFHSQAAPNAVRNRKAYFHQLLHSHSAGRTKVPLNVLNVASGPARDVREWVLDNPECEVFFDCVDAEIHAIERAKKLCAPFGKRVEFYHRNVLRFLPARGYELVWSAGLFDYLTDRTFVFLLKALMAVTKRGGEVVVGNFSDYNPSRDYMELLGDWVLHHRTRDHLRALALEAGAAADSIEVMWEPEGVNLFLHIRR
ncbi:class I SAM-dependent methyltransferase [Prosthecobacter fluviatilis]|uniref:Class I SAM-dependent methyltransferase n=1 Tax=Prosthecobacter fluviatilis TaxID=445931 RepID=A0ABW0KPM9_9BACT